MANTDNDTPDDNTPDNAPETAIVGDPMWFSPSTCTIYREQWKARYKAGTGWPADAKLLTADQFNQFRQPAPGGTKLGADAEGNPTWVPLPPLTDAQAATLFNSRLNNALDFVAKEWGYDKGIDNATTWATSSNAQFAAEGKALATWRDQVWVWAAAQPAGTVSRDGMPPPPDRPGTNSPTVPAPADDTTGATA